MKFFSEFRTPEFLLHAHSLNVRKILSAVVERNVASFAFCNRNYGCCLLTLGFLILGKLIDSLVFFTYPQLWIMLFVTLVMVSSSLLWAKR
jgi:hypothetical protein